MTFTLSRQEPSRLRQHHTQFSDVRVLHFYFNADEAFSFRSCGYALCPSSLSGSSNANCLLVIVCKPFQHLREPIADMCPHSGVGD